MSVAPKMNKAERLAVAGAVAPTLRAQSERTRQRVVKVYDQATGEVVRHATLADVQRGILETAKIELAVGEGARPTHVPCEFCGRMVAAGKRSTPKSCRGGCDRQQTCVGWGDTEGRCNSVPGRSAFTPQAVRSRHGQEWMCQKCAMRRLHSDPEWRAKVAHSLHERSQDPEHRAKHAEAMRKLATDPVYRAKRLEAGRKRSQDPEWRAKVAEGIRRADQSPERRKTRSAGARKREAAKRARRSA